MSLMVHTDSDNNPVEVSPTNPVPVIATAGTALLGEVGIDQTTPNANKVVVKEILAGTNKIGKVGSDITVAPEISNTTMTNADTEYSHALPANAKRIRAWVEDGDDTFNYRLAFVTGKVATPTAPYMKLNADILYDSEQVSLVSGTLYFGCSDAGKVMCVEVWT